MKSRNRCLTPLLIHGPNNYFDTVREITPNKTKGNSRFTTKC